MVKVKKDLVGEKFGKLLVIKRVEDYISPKGRELSQWLCKCDCGNDVVVIGNNLIKENGTRSCGCYAQECRCKSKNKKSNRYDLSGEYGIGYTSKGEEFYFDLEDYDKIKDYCWCIDKKGYVMASKYYNGKSDCLMLHRIVMKCPTNMFVDHINHNKKNNQKYNLRVCTNQQNSINKSKRSDNTSGVAGVYWNKRDSVWVANICINRKNKHLGQSKSLDEAIKIRKNAEEKYFGEFSYDNSIRN